MPICPSCKTVFVVQKSLLTDCPRCRSAYNKVTGVWTEPPTGALIPSLQEALRFQRIKPRKTSWSDEELTLAFKDYIHKKFSKDRDCTFCQAPFPTDFLAQKTLSKTVSFKFTTCCIDLEVAVDELISNATERLEMLKEVDGSESGEI